MDYYYVNKNAQSTGEHEVHKSTCSYLPNSSNLISLGYFSSCADAVKKAKEHYSNVDAATVVMLVTKDKQHVFSKNVSHYVRR